MSHGFMPYATKKLIVINTTHEPKQAHLEAAEAHGQVVQPPHKDKLVVHACVVQEQPISSIGPQSKFGEAAQTKVSKLTEAWESLSTSSHRSNERMLPSVPVMTERSLIADQQT